jgi:hypothetical protein
VTVFQLPKPVNQDLSGMVRSTGMALAWIGRAVSFDARLEREKSVLARLAFAVAPHKRQIPGENENRPALRPNTRYSVGVSVG